MGEYLDLLRRNQNFRYLWWGNVVSLLGDWFNLLASAALVTELTSSGVAISYLFLVRFLPQFLFSPLAGVIADRYDRKTIMVVSDLLRAATVLGFLLIRSADQLWLFYLLTAIQFMLSAMFVPARAAALANVVEQKDLVTANALDSFTWSTMLALGSFLGGVIAALFGNQTAFVMDALTFVLSAWLISRIVMPKRDVLSASSSTGGWLEFVDGMRYLWLYPLLLVISLVKAAGSFVWGAINVLEVSYADHVYPLSNPALVQWFSLEDGGTATLGLIYVAAGLGTGLGPLLMRRWLGDAIKRLMIGISIGFSLTAIGILLLGRVNTLPTFLGATFVRTFGTGTIWVFSAVLLQIMVPDRVKGRVFGFEFAALTLTQSLSVLAAGYAQDALLLPLNQITQVFGGLGIIVFLLWMLFFLTNQKNLRKHETVRSDGTKTVI
ncbi:MAG TPA: MFS transporter [Anaerolineales bacterium]|nr:MFS transporter [Anaerolineales bacterium]